MTSRADIIKAQESIGNVEISEEQFNDWELENKVEVSYREGKYISFLYFAPRSIVHPEEKIGCGENEIDNHSQDGGVAKPNGIPVPSKRDEERAIVGSNPTPDNIQSSKIFEDVIKLIDEEFPIGWKKFDNDNRKSIEETKYNGKNLKNQLIYIHEEIEKLYNNLKSKIKEKWGED